MGLCERPFHHILLIVFATKNTGFVSESLCNDFANMLDVKIDRENHAANPSVLNPLFFVFRIIGGQVLWEIFWKYRSAKEVIRAPNEDDAFRFFCAFRARGGGDVARDPASDGGGHAELGQ